MVYYSHSMRKYGTRAEAREFKALLKRFGKVVNPNDGHPIVRGAPMDRWLHTNRGQHWKFTHGTDTAEWWPSSAKLVINQKWQKGVHCHDWTQVVKILERRFK